jgi:enoyl-CoA hydratase/carnithine racemase
MAGGEAEMEGVYLEVEGAVATIMIDRQEDENQLTFESLLRLKSIVGEVGDRDDVHAVVVRGRGSEFFCTGVLNPALRGSMSKDDVLRLVFLAGAVFDAVEALPQMVIAGINGTARAGGVELALACDMRIATADARLSLPEARWGGFPGAGAPVRLPVIVGYGRAAELIATGREVNAEEMLRTGLVEHVVPGAAFDNALRDLAVTTASSGPLATRGAKRIMRLRREAGPHAARQLSDVLRRSLEYSQDVDEGIGAHREGRRPMFTGR